jgi:hypothetical protein
LGKNIYNIKNKPGDIYKGVTASFTAFLDFFLIIAVYLFQRFGNGLNHLVIVLGKQCGNGGGIGGLKQLIRLNIEDIGEFDHACGGKICKIYLLAYMKVNCPMINLEVMPLDKKKTAWQF